MTGNGEKQLIVELNNLDLIKASESGKAVHYFRPGGDEEFICRAVSEAIDIAAMNKYSELMLVRGQLFYPDADTIARIEHCLDKTSKDIPFERVFYKSENAGPVLIYP